MTEPRSNEPANPKKPARAAGQAATQKEPAKVRPCTFLFVLGSGFDPVDHAMELSESFQSSARAGCDFSAAKPVVKEADEWLADDAAGFKTSVTNFARDWFDRFQMPFDESRLLMRDYTDEGDRRYAVAGYFPRQAGDVSDNDDDSDDAAPLDEPEVVFEAAPSAAKLAMLKAVEFVKAQPKKRLITIAAVLVLAVIAIAVGPVVVEKTQSLIADIQAAAKSDPIDGHESDSKPKTDASKDDSSDHKLAAAKFSKATVKVYTPEPDFFVTVDGNPVRDTEGELVKTPCAVTTSVGPHRISVCREGWLDLERRVNVAPDSEVSFDVSEDEKGVGSEILSSPHLRVAVGEPIPLKALNSSSPEVDPFVTADSLTIWFAGDRKDGRGIFMATRPTQFHDFEAPKLISRGADLAATPSISDDELFIVYAVPEKARLVMLSRPNATSAFSDKKTLRQGEKDGTFWPSSQILGDGKRVYWTEIDDDKFAGYSMSRKELLKDFDKTLKVHLPGEHPCLSPDGLRQYDFDGKKLTRYRRPNLNTKFGADGDVIAELELGGYEAVSEQRQYFVAADEQWLFYCDNPSESGDLFMVRLSDGPMWGLKPTGKSIPAKAALAKTDKTEKVDPATTGEPKPAPESMVKPETTASVKPEPKPEPKPPAKPVDPRTIPLPYASHWKAYVALMSERKYDDALALWQTNRTNPAFEPFKELLDWDQQEFKALQAFWEDIDKSLKGMAVKEEFRIGPTKLEFVEYTDGILIGRRGTAEVKRAYKELAASDLSGIFDRIHKGPEPEPQHRFAAFLTYDKQAVERTLRLRADKAGELGATLMDRRARRRLALGKAEFDRKNYGVGAGFLLEAEQLAEPGSPIRKEIDDIQSILLTLVKWTPRGKRTWDIADGVYKASTQRFENSMLISSEQFANFELKLEWMCEDAVQSQGGVYFHYAGTGDIYENSYKIHVANDPGVRPDSYSSGSLFGISSPSSNAVKKFGEWNTLNIKVVSEKVTVLINGKQVLRTDLGSTKIPKKGFVGLDGGIGGVTYRKVVLSELPGE